VRCERWIVALLLLPARFPHSPSRVRCARLSALPGVLSAATAVLNMASDGMILTNHDHQIRVGVLTGKGQNPLCHRVVYLGGKRVRISSCLPAVPLLPKCVCVCVFVYVRLCMCMCVFACFSAGQRWFSALSPSLPEINLPANPLHDKAAQLLVNLYLWCHYEISQEIIVL